MVSTWEQVLNRKDEAEIVRCDSGTLQSAAILGAIHAFTFFPTSHASVARPIGPFPVPPTRRAPISMAEDSRISQTSSTDVTYTCHLDKIAASHSTCLPRKSDLGPVWTTSPIAKENDFRLPLVRSSISFCFTSRLFAPHSTSSYFTLEFYQPMSPHPCRPLYHFRTPYNDFVNFLHATHRCSSSTSPRGSVDDSTISTFVLFFIYFFHL